MVAAELKFSSFSDLQSSNGEFEYGFGVEEDISGGLSKWAIARNANLDSKSAAEFDDISIGGLKIKIC